MAFPIRQSVTGFLRTDLSSSSTDIAHEEKHRSHVKCCRTDCMWCRKYQRRGLGWLTPWTQGEKTTAFAFSLRWQRYRRTAVENSGYYQSESDVFFNRQNAQGWLWALPATRFELPAMTAFIFSLIPAQLLIGNSSDLTNSIGMAQLLPNAKSYCSKTFAFALLVVIQSML